ncbi:MAG: pilus assembly protein [Brachymonas sp.]
MNFFNKSLYLVVGFVLAALQTNAQAVTIPKEPLTIQATAAKPMIMLGVGRDHRMFYEAYNDASDIDGDGTLEIRFKPSIVYLGLFNSDLCYTHSGKNDNTGLFSPAGPATLPNRTCTNQWSGNWLNYVTTSRIDALRVVLYGGTREVDNSSQTILRRSYIPQDGHSWAKEYTSLAEDGYLISSYTPLAQPAVDRRHFFGSLTQNSGTNCNPLETCSSLPPWLSVVLNSTKRVWEWASSERPVLRDNSAPGFHGGTSRTNYTVRVEVCTSSFNTGCKLYPHGNYKPVGLLHEYGENDAALFGMISGSYDSHLSGGRLRKVISSFSEEINPTNGTFVTVTGTVTLTGIISNFDAFRIYGFNRGNTSQIYAGTVVGNRTVIQGEFPDWGNPVGELMYEAMRYFANKGTPTAAYIGSNTIDDLMGLSRPSWDRPYAGQGTSTAKAPFCAKATLLTISDTNISFDSDQLPGVSAIFSTDTFTTDLNGRHIITDESSSLNVSTVADFISANESSVTGLKFIGQSGNTFDTAPSAKTVASLSSIRGLAPEEPTKRGSYYSASVAHYAKVNDLNTTLAGNQTVDNFIVALSSPLPRIDAKLPNERVITLVPFAKSVHGPFGITSTTGQFQPTNQIIDFYVQSIANSGPGDVNTATNGGRYEAVFRISYEDVEQGADHEMDAVVIYTVRANADNTLNVTLQTIHQSSNVKHRMGYVISGTTNDGIYLVVQDEKDEVPYFLNVPPGRSPGYCNIVPVPGDCSRLPYLGGEAAIAATSTSAATRSISSFTFTPGTTTAATFLKDPLWYAAKWGGFTDINHNGRPDVAQEWDQDGDGQPDTYFFVQNLTKLKASLTKAFESITDRQSSSSNLAANSTSSQTAGALLYRANYTAGKWIGEIEAFPITASNLTVPPVWRASQKIGSWNDRKIYVHASTISTPSPTLVDMRSVAFGDLSLSDQASITSATIYNYVRGDASAEVRNGGSLRNRESILSDVIHSSPLYDDESGMFFIGSNGGMLHAFNGLTGTETFAIIPRQVLPKLKNLSTLAYATSHDYFVDGDVARSFKTPETNNKRYIYSLLGRGGKGLFSIDPRITGTVANPSLLWEYTPAGSAAAAVDPDLGLMLSRPQFLLLNNGKAGLAVGNGFNSTSGKAVLYIFIINADGTLDQVRKLDTGIASDNGMSGATFYDDNGDLKADYLYSADLKGNLWKFNVSDSNPANWTVSNGIQPIFKAVDGTSTLAKPQPVTAPVWATYNNLSTDHTTRNQVFVYFGTGSYFKIGDKTDLSVQSWYGIIDSTSTVATLRSDLIERTIASYSTITGRLTRSVSSAAPNDMVGKKGWHIDFKNPINGERMINRSILETRTMRPSLLATSFYPINDNVCIPGGDSYINAVDPYSGANLGIELFPGFGNASSLDLNVGIASLPLPITDQCVGLNCQKPETSTSREICYGAACKLPPTPPDCAGNVNLKLPGSDDFGSEQASGCNSGSLRGRLSWREIIKD